MRIMNFTIETEQDVDGRWIAEVVELPGARKYGSTRSEAIAQAEALAPRKIAARTENDERASAPITISFAA